MFAFASRLDDVSGMAMIIAMKFASTAELKNDTNRLLRDVEKGAVLVVTRHGKPVAALQKCSEDGIEDLVLETSASIKRSVDRAERDINAGRGITLAQYKARRAP
jgi:prevent-host-death family protein